MWFGVSFDDGMCVMLLAPFGSGAASLCLQSCATVTVSLCGILPAVWGTLLWNTEKIRLLETFLRFPTTLG